MLSYGMYLSFFLIAGTFVLLMLLILITLLVKHKSVGKSVAFSSLRNFVICFFCIILIFYSTSYVEMNTGVFQRGALGRAADFALAVLLQYFWVSFIRAQGLLKENFSRCISIVIAALLIISTFNSVAFVNDNYYVTGAGARIFCTGVEVFMGIIFCAMNLFWIGISVKSEINKNTKKYIIIMSALMAANVVRDELVTIRLMLGKMGYEPEAFYYDPTNLVMLCTAIITLVYLFRHDFSPIYFQENVKREVSDEEVLEHLAAQYGLSNRETEIAKLIFHGDSYEEIAENLVISKLTVKKHVHNLYEKLDVAKRMDLINLVRTEKEHIQQNRP